MYMEKYEALIKNYKLPPQGVWSEWDDKQKRKFLKLQNYSDKKQEYPICAIDIETTGLDPLKHAMIQIAIVPLNQDFRPLDIEPFYLFTLYHNPLWNILIISSFN